MLKETQRALKSPRASLGSLSEAAGVVDRELLAGLSSRRVGTAADYRETMHAICRWISSSPEAAERHYP